MALRTAVMLCSLALAGSSGSVRAQTQTETETETETEPRCETMRCVAEGDESASEALLWVPRAVLRLPRLVLDTSMRLLVLGARVEEDQRIAERITDLLFNDERTFGVVPTAFYETGLRPSVGARLIHRDLAGRREGLRLRVLYAGIEQQTYEAQLHSGSRLGALRLQGKALYTRYQDGRFYGLGNADEVDTLRGVEPRSAFERDVAVRSRYRGEEARGSVGLSRQLSAELGVGGTLQIRRRALSVGDERSREGTPYADEVFTEDSLTGLGEPFTDGSGELILTFRDQRSTLTDVPLALASTGFRAVAWLGAQTALEGGHGSFARLGGDVRRYIDLAQGNRVLVLRLRTAWALGTLRSMPFPDLPTLGGSQLLRGYPAGRFRDRGSLLATAEYRYPVQDNLASYLFVDAGRVADTWDDVSPSGLAAARIGYGAGLFLFTSGGLLLRIQLASSLDGGLFFHFLLDADDGYVRTS